MLSNASDVKIIYPKLKEADPNSIVPTTSTSFVMLICDCLATTIMEKKKFMMFYILAEKKQRDQITLIF